VKKVIIVDRVFPDYRKAVFDSLSEKVNLKVLSGKNNSGIKSISTIYSEIIPTIKYGKKETAILLFPLLKILKYLPKIVICDFALGFLNLPFILLACKFVGIRFVFWSHGYNRKAGFEPERKWKDKYRLFLLKLADANILYGEPDKALLKKYLSGEKLFVAQNTVDTPKLTRIREDLEKEGKQKVKTKLKIGHVYNIIFVSRLLALKQPELLINVYEILKCKYNKIVGVHYVGDGEMLQIIKREVDLKSYNNDFYFHGAIHNDYLNGELLFVSDIMVNPGYLGLSINHAFCFDCPVVTFKEKNGFPAHSPEIEYLINNETGFVLEEHSPEAIALSINTLLSNDALKENFKCNIRQTVKTVFPLEKMVDGIIDCIDYLQPGTNSYTCI